MARNRDRLGPIGVDLGGHRVKLLQLAERGGELSVLAFAEFPMPAVETPGERDEQLAHLLSRAIRAGGFVGRRAVSCLGPGEYELKNVRVPPMPPDELASAVELEALERFAADPGAMQFRHLPAGQVRQGNDVREEVIVFATQRAAIDRRVALLERAGLDPMALDIAPGALARAFGRYLRRASDSAGVNLFLDVGERGTCLTMMRGAELCFVKLIDVGGAVFTRGVAQRLSIDPAEAHALRLRVMRARLRPADVEPDPHLTPELIESVADGVRPGAEQLAREVHLSLRYVTVTFRGQRPDCITFVGGEAHEPVLLPLVGQGLDIACTVGDPMLGIEGSEGVSADETRGYVPAWAVATGLALRGLQAGTPPTAAQPAASAVDKAGVPA
ncbi:MAG: pilus assembly protein PilM [Phycisphaerae bacterium]